ncbi:MAG TPA: penicillinase repressor [Cytophagales bacterium]|nr:penicillinase repressor [Cytophagales bacterium]HAA20218.1 penicillinase repressor [Cytophagales bacterium]HAP64140.1 penicillinase repressor [Cytophagales bacterium]
MAKGNKGLTKAEEELMQHLWSLEKGYLKDILEAYPEPRPAYTTVATVIRVLVKKGFIAFNTHGKVHEYYPAVSKQVYFKKHLSTMVSNFFGGSMTRFASFFTTDKDLDLDELEQIKAMIEEEIEQRKDQ